MSNIFLSMFANQTLHDPHKPSDRVRVLEDWFLDKFPANAPGIDIYRLKGWTVREADGTEPPARITTTSPIKKIDGDIVTTASGSIYTLGKPLDPNFKFQHEHTNPWIDGDNWITY